MDSVYFASVEAKALLSYFSFTRTHLVKVITQQV